MKKVSNEKKVFRSKVMVRKDINDKIKRLISYIKYEIQISIEKKCTGRKKKGKIILVAW